jgi:hypothetical protein
MIMGGGEVPGEKGVQVPLCPPQISHGLIRDRTLAFGEMLVTNRLRHDTAHQRLILSCIILKLSFPTV